MPKEILGVQLYTKQEAAQMLGVTLRTITNYTKDGRLKGQIIGGQRVYTVEELQKFLKGE